MKRTIVAVMCFGLSGAAMAQTPTTLPPAAAMTPATSAAAAVVVTGTWKVAGDVQGVSVLLSCALIQTDAKVAGTCTDEEKRVHAVQGAVTGRVVVWSFDSEYQGSPITVSMTGRVDESGAKMSGTIYVDPMQADGTFAATKEVAAAS